MNKDIKIVLQIQKINPQLRPTDASQHGIGKLVNKDPKACTVSAGRGKVTSSGESQLIITALDSSEWGDLTQAEKITSAASPHTILVQDRGPMEIEPHPILRQYIAGQRGASRFSMVIKDCEIGILTKPESIKELYTVLSDNNQIKGLLQGKLRNIIKGLTTKHKKRMVLNGVGYWIKQESSELANWLYINIGYKDPIKKKIPSNINIEIGNFSEGGQNNELICESNNLEELTNWMSSIRQLKPGYKDKYKRKGWSSIS